MTLENLARSARLFGMFVAIAAASVVGGMLFLGWITGEWTQIVHMNVLGEGPLEAVLFALGLVCLGFAFSHYLHLEKNDG